MLRNVSDAVDWFLSVLTAEQRASLRTMQEGELLDLHFTVGSSIREKMTPALLRAFAEELRDETAAQVREWCNAIGIQPGEDVPPMFRRLLEREALLPGEASNIIVRRAWRRLREEAGA